MRNPFRPNKFELDSRPLIWVSPFAAEIMKESGSAYVAGARGSGKTSILKAIDSAEQSENLSLKAQLDPVATGSVGVYMRVQDLFTQSFAGVPWSNLGAGDERVLEYTFLASLIEAEASYRLLKLLVAWRSSGVISYSFSEARSVAAALARAFPQLSGVFGEGRSDPLDDAAQAFLHLRKSLARALLRGDALQLEALLVAEPLEMVRTVALSALPFIDRHRPGRNLEPLSFKICVDECDYLTAHQQIALNTLVRRTSAPVDFVVAYVDSSYDPTTTLFENLTLSGADRRVYKLSFEESSDFDQLCEAIVAYRLFYYENRRDKSAKRLPSPSKYFPLDKKLGEFSANALIFEMIGQSPSMTGLIARAEALQADLMTLPRSKISKKTLSELEFSDDAPPIFQQFIIERLGIDIHERLAMPEQKAGFLASLRRKQRGAMLQIATAARKQKLPYYGKRVLLALADRCARDFLDIMAEIFDLETRRDRKELVSYFRSPDQLLRIESQRRGAQRAADSKFQGIEHRPSLEPGSRVEVPDREGQALTRLIDALGRLTHFLQASTDGLGSLTTAERGIFLIDLKAIRRFEEVSPSSPLSLASVLARGIRENHLVADSVRLTRPRTETAIDPSVVRFRLNTRFAPRYKFSYLGAIEDVVLPADATIELLRVDGDFSVEEWARRLAERLLPGDGGLFLQADLFSDGVSYE